MIGIEPIAELPDPLGLFGPQKQLMKNRTSTAHRLAFVLIGIEGFEPSTPPPQTECADQTALYSEIIA